MNTAIQIQNLKCGGCIHTIQSKITALTSISNVEIKQENTTISFDYIKTEDIVRVKQKLISLGYPPIEDQNNLLLKAKSMISCAAGKINKQ